MFERVLGEVLKKVSIFFFFSLQLSTFGEALNLLLGSSVLRVRDLAARIWVNCSETRDVMAMAREEKHLHVNRCHGVLSAVSYNFGGSFVSMMRLLLKWVFLLKSNSLGNVDTKNTFLSSFNYVWLTLHETEKKVLV